MNFEHPIWNHLCGVAVCVGLTVCFAAGLHQFVGGASLASNSVTIVIGAIGIAYAVSRTFLLGWFAWLEDKLGCVLGPQGKGGADNWTAGVPPHIPGDDD